MDNSTQRRPVIRRRLMDRLDAATQDLNAVLLALAIGLAVLDFTCFFVFEVRKSIPPHLPPAASVVTPATAVIPPAQAMAPAGARGSGG